MTVTDTPPENPASLSSPKAENSPDSASDEPRAKKRKKGPLAKRYRRGSTNHSVTLFDADRDALDEIIVQLYEEAGIMINLSEAIRLRIRCQSRSTDTLKRAYEEVRNDDTRSGPKGRKSRA